MTKSTYRDFDMSFRAHPVTGDLIMKNDVQAVLQSIRNLVLTSAGEFLMEPNIGGDVYQILFEPNDTMLRMQLYDKITRTIKIFEPRVELSNLVVKSFADGHGIYIQLTFYMLNNPEPITENIPLKRTR
jgi:phage baseplate assembly protein W